MVILSPDYETAKEAAETLFLIKPKNEDGTDRPTHGKLYYDRTAKTLWTGSANCSLNGLTKNVEYMVEAREAADVWEEKTGGGSSSAGG